MLASLPPSSAISETLVQTAVPLLAKETYEGAVMILADALPSHISFLLSNNNPLTPEVTGLISKEMGGIKPSIRHAFCLMAGSALWSGTKTTDTGATLEFTKAILPALNTTLKNVAANPLNASGGVLEAYIAIALLLGPLAKSGEFDDFVAKNPVLHGISNVGVKPSFLLWDKVYQKATDVNDEIWLLRACEAAVVYFNAEISKSEALRLAITL